MTTYKRWAPCDGVVFSYKRGEQLYKTKGGKTKIYELCSNIQMAIVNCDANPSSNCSANSLLFNSIPRVSSLHIAVPTSVLRQTQRWTIWQCRQHLAFGSKTFGSGGIRTHASEETGALNQRLRPLGHATLVPAMRNLWVALGARYTAYLLNTVHLFDARGYYRVHSYHSMCIM